MNAIDLLNIYDRYDNINIETISSFSDNYKYVDL